MKPKAFLLYSARWATASIMLLFAAVCTAQTVGRLRLLVDPGSNYEFILDGKYRLQQREVELSTGPHRFTFWAPERQVTDTTVNVLEGRTSDVIIRLPYSSEYVQWKRDLEDFRNDRKLRRLLPSVLTAASIAYTVVRFNGYKKAHDQLEDDLAAYDDSFSPQATRILKEQTIPAHKDEFRRAEGNFILAAAISVAAIGSTAYLFHRSGRKKVPVFIDREKVRFDGLVWVPGPEGGDWSGGLTWNFSR